MLLPNNLTILTNLSSIASLLPAAPTPPDIVLCHADYGLGLTTRDGFLAGAQLPDSKYPQQYFVGRTSAQYHLPFYVSFGSVVISVEVGGPSAVRSITLTPNQLRGMAGYLVSHCVGTEKTGGFITTKIANVVDYVTDPKADLDLPYPPTTAFVTLTMSDHKHSFSSPGDYDPALAITMQKAALDAINHVAPAFHTEIANRIFKFAEQATRMRRLGHIPWWGSWASLPSIVNANGTSNTNGYISNKSAQAIVIS